MRRGVHLRAMAVAVAACALTLGACGGDDEEAPQQPAGTQPPPGQTADPEREVKETVVVEMDAVEEGARLSFTEEAVQAAAGPLQIILRNPAGAKGRHGIAIEGQPGRQEGQPAAPGGTSLVYVPDLPAGEYTFYCPVGDHRQRGMEGTLAVE